MNHHDADMTDVVVVLDPLDDAQTQEAVTSLQTAGLAVTNVNNEESIVEGCVDAAKLGGLKKVAGVRYVRSVMTYAVDFPPGDPRDTDGPQEACDDSAD